MQASRLSLFAQLEHVHLSLPVIRLRPAASQQLTRSAVAATAFHQFWGIKLERLTWIIEGQQGASDARLRAFLRGKETEYGAQTSRRNSNLQLFGTRRVQHRARGRRGCELGRECG
jgi:hypothetical protein